MRLGGLREGELVFDPQLERATLDPRQHLPRPRDELRTGGDVVGDGGARQKERALLVQDLRVERSDRPARLPIQHHHADRKSTRLNSSHPSISYAVFCLKKKKKIGKSRFAAAASSAILSASTR